MHHLSLYFHFVKLRIRSQMAYRLSFVFDLLAQASISVIDFFMIALLFNRFKQLEGWSLWEVGFLYGMIGICFAVAEMIGRGFDVFQRNVLRGDFDTMLVRPLGTFFQVFSHEFLLRRVGRIAQALVVFVIANSQLTISWSFVKVGYLLVSLVSGTCFFIGLFVIGATSCFWTVQSIEIINIFTNGGVFMGSYPFSIYRWWFRHFFYLYRSIGMCQLFSVSFLIRKNCVFWNLAVRYAIGTFRGVSVSRYHCAVLAMGGLALSKYGTLNGYQFSVSVVG